MFRRSMLALVALGSVAPTLFAQEKAADKPTTVTPSDKKTDWWQKRHEQFLERTKKGGVDVAFLGDSITQGWEGAGKAAWDKHFAPLKAANYGIGGDQTQHVLWRITEGKELDGIHPKVAVVMIGTNNIAQHSAEDIALGVEAIVKTLREKERGIKVLLLAVFPRSAKSPKSIKEDSVGPKGLQPKIDAINKIVAKLHDGKSVHFMNINDKLLEKDGSLARSVMPDYLHLSPEGYDRWATAIHAKVKELLK
jgi:lysophospholipase L1-like esterase